MKKITVPVQNLILAVGLVCILAGLFLMTLFAAEIDAPVSPSATFVMVLGAVIFYLSMVFLHWASFFFIGMCFFFFGLTTMFISTNILPYGMSQLWPAELVLCGICLLLTSIFKHKKVRGVYLFPSSLMIGLGLFFLLFSFNIIQISFAEFISRWFPFILIFFGGGLLSIFFYQKKANGTFPYDKDDLADLTDDDDSFSGENL